MWDPKRLYETRGVIEVREAPRDASTRPICHTPDADLRVAVNARDALQALTRRVYAQRDESLKRLGYATYAAYLSSARWRSIRARVLAARSTCMRCGRLATQVHHGSYDYETMAGDQIALLFSCCGKCHTKAERFGKRRGGRGTPTMDRLAYVTQFLMMAPVPTHLPRSVRRALSREKREAWIHELQAYWEADLLRDRFDVVRGGLSMGIPDTFTARALTRGWIRHPTLYKPIFSR